MNARSLGAHVIERAGYGDFAAALDAARATGRTTVITIKNDRYARVPGYESGSYVHVAEVSEMPAVREARKASEEMRAKERHFFES